MKSPTTMGRTILLIDDDDEVREVAAEVLALMGYTVLQAPTGDLAVILIESHPEIELLFTDIVMPGIDGFKLADMVKFRRPEIKILYTTGFIHRVDEHLGIVHGEILNKPYHPDNLVAAIERAFA
jgi:CheY-like chemotaxis protein